MAGGRLNSTRRLAGIAISVLALLVATAHSASEGEAAIEPAPPAAASGCCCSADAAGPGADQAPCDCSCPKCPVSNEHHDECPCGCPPGNRTVNVNTVTTTLFPPPAGWPLPQDVYGRVVDAAFQRPPSASLDSPLRPPRA